MKCLKCGTEIPEEEVFCMECLLEAQRYPVDPGAAVYLPRQKVVEVPKKVPRRRVRTAEEQVKLLRRRIRVQAMALVLFAAIALALAYPLISGYTKTHHRTGQNYSAVVPASSAPSETSAP